MTTATKELLIRSRPEGYLCEIYYEGGGELPRELAGKFTSPRIAQARINVYKAKKEASKPVPKKSSQLKKETTSAKPKEAARA